MTAEHTDMRFCRWLVILMVGFLACHPLIAAEAPSDDSLFYYKIGGGRDIAIPPSLNITTIDLSLSGQASALSCSGFDPMVAIESSLDNLRNGVDNAVNAIELAATAAIANLPGYILQKANPGLYDLFQNALLRANESFSLATKSCERIQYEIAKNTNPLMSGLSSVGGIPGNAPSVLAGPISTMPSTMPKTHLTMGLNGWVV